MSKITPEEQFLQNINRLDLQDGNLSDQDALALIQLTKTVAEKQLTMMPIKPLSFLEIGPWKGKSTACLSLVASKYPNSKIYCVDHFKGSPNTTGEQVAKKIDILNVFRHNMKAINAQSLINLMVMDFRDAFNLFREQVFDLIYIDMDNNFLSMDMAIDWSINAVQDFGVICGRNFTVKYDEVKDKIQEEINQEYSRKYNFHPGIIQAVHSNLKKTPFHKSYKRIKNSSIWYWEK